MGLTGLIMLFVMFLAIIFIIISISFYRKGKKVFKQPTLLGVSAFLLQVLLIVLFFSGILIRFNELTDELLWWGITLYGFVIGVKEIKHNIIISLLTIYISILLTI